MKQGRDNRKLSDALVLVAEDDEVSTMFLKKMLAQAGLRADFVADGQAAIRALEAADYDLVLMDCFMPVMDGFATTRLIRSADTPRINPGIPIIAMTGLSGENDRNKCLDAGMDAYLCKPVSAADLIMTIEQQLDRAVGVASLPSQGDGESETGWDEAMLESMIDSFLLEIPRVIDELQREIDGGEGAGFESIGHKLRGACDIMGLSTLSSRSRALELAGRAGGVSETRKCAVELIGELQKMEAVLTGHAD